MAFSPDGKFLASGLCDGTILIWDVGAIDAKLLPAPKLTIEGLESRWTDLTGDDASAAAGLKIADVNPPELVRALDALRVRKTPYEVACLAEATRRAAPGHQELRRLFRGADRSELSTTVSRARA